MNSNTNVSYLEFRFPIPDEIDVEVITDAFGITEKPSIVPHDLMDSGIPMAHSVVAKQLAKTGFVRAVHFPSLQIAGVHLQDLKQPKNQLVISYTAGVMAGKFWLSEEQRAMDHIYGIPKQVLYDAYVVHGPFDTQKAKVAYVHDSLAGGNDDQHCIWCLTDNEYVKHLIHPDKLKLLYLTYREYLLGGGKIDYAALINEQFERGFQQHHLTANDLFDQLIEDDPALAARFSKLIDTLECQIRTLRELKDDIIHTNYCKIIDGKGE